MLLRQVLEDLSTGCTKYVNLSKASVTGPGTGKTKLDKERLKLCQKEIVSNIRFYFSELAFEYLYISHPFLHN